MTSKLLLTLSVLGFAAANQAEAPCGTCLNNDHIYCYHGNSELNWFNQDFNDYSEFSHTCC